MPSLWSADESVSTCCGSAICFASASVIVFSLLPLAALQAEPGDENGEKEERDHRRRDGRALAEIAAHDAALIGIGRHQVRGIDRSAARHHPDELEIGEGE